MGIQFRDVTAAAERIAGAIVKSPCPASSALSEATGMKVFCKLEYLQRTGSFKERGARNALLLLPPAQRKIGVIAASAGNHALGLAYHARSLGIPVTVVMPQLAPLTKVVNCRRLGAEVVLFGRSIEEAREHAEGIVVAKRLAYINGYDDPAIIAGQGTRGLEIIEQVPDLEAVVVPVGGAGLVAGVALAVKTSQPHVQIIGVEPSQVASFHAALLAGRPVKVEAKPTLADGLAVAQVGSNAFEIARAFVDKAVVVNEHDIALGVLRLIELEKAVVEGAGATPLAACLAGLLPELRGKKVIFLLTGGNIDTNILGRIIERGLASDGRLCRFSAVISDRPGGLAAFAGIVAGEGASIIDVTHDRAFAGDDINAVKVHCVVETRDRAHLEELLARLRREGFQISAN
jgi:threonine dehydratase